MVIESKGFVVTWVSEMNILCPDHPPSYIHLALYPSSRRIRGASPVPGGGHGVPLRPAICQASRNFVYLSDIDAETPWIRYESTPAVLGRSMTTARADRALAWLRSMSDRAHRVMHVPRRSSGSHCGLQRGKVGVKHRCLRDLERRCRRSTASQ